MSAVATEDDSGLSVLTRLWDASEAYSEEARATEPLWAGPLITGSAVLGNRFRFDVAWQHSQDSTSTTFLDGSKGLGLVVSDADEVVVSGAPYDLRTLRGNTGQMTGFSDWPILRFEHRFASSPENADDYLLTAWVQVQAPEGITRLSNKAWTWTPEIAFGKGWGDFDIQATLSGTIPTSHSRSLGQQVRSSVCFQYRVFRFFWPEVEFSGTYYPDGERGGLTQVYMTTGVVVGLFRMSNGLKFGVGAGYEIALAPSYRAEPLTPAFDHALIASTRLSF